MHQLVNKMQSCMFLWETGHKQNWVSISDFHVFIVFLSCCRMKYGCHTSLFITPLCDVCCGKLIVWWLKSSIQHCVYLIMLVRPYLSHLNAVTTVVPCLSNRNCCNIIHISVKQSFHLILPTIPFAVLICPMCASVIWLSWKYWLQNLFSCFLSPFFFLQW